MSTINEALYGYLSANAGIVALINDRIYPEIADAGAPLPYIVYTQINKNSVHSSEGSAGLAFRRIQFSIWATTTSERQSIAEALRDAFDGLRATLSGVDVRSVLLQNEFSVTDNAEDGSEAPIFGTHQEYVVCHKESIPALAGS